MASGVADVSYRQWPNSFAPGYCGDLLDPSLGDWSALLSDTKLSEMRRRWMGWTARAESEWFRAANVQPRQRLALLLDAGTTGTGVVESAVYRRLPPSALAGSGFKFRRSSQPSDPLASI